MATKLNPVLYLAIDGLDYQWSLKSIPHADCDATTLADFMKENRFAARAIRTQIGLGSTGGKVRIVP